MGYQSTASRAGNRLASDALFEGEAVAPFLEPYDKDQSKDLVDISRYADQEIHANIATDMRSTLDVPNTFKNWVKTLCSSTLNWSAEDVAKIEALDMAESAFFDHDAPETVNWLLGRH